MYDVVVINIFRYILYLYVIRWFNKFVFRLILFFGFFVVFGIVVWIVGKSEINFLLKRIFIVVVEVFFGVIVLFGNVSYYDIKLNNICN